METLAQKIARTSLCLIFIHPAFKNPISRIIVMTVLHFRTFPDSKADFAAYLLSAIPYLFANSPRLISSENMGLLHALYDTGTNPAQLDWVAVLAKLADPTTTGPFWIHEQQTRRHQIEQLMLDIFDDIPKSTWTSLDRTTLRRPEKSTARHASYLMEVAPDLTVADVIFHGVKMHLHNPETPETDEMPLYQFVLLEWFIGPATTPLLGIVPTFNKVVKRALYLIPFLPGDVGQTVFVRATYVNTVGGKSLFTTDWIPQVIR
jgi:hypothetical protein